MTVNAISHVDAVEDKQYGHLVIIRTTEDMAFSPEAARAFACHVIEVAGKLKSQEVITKKARAVLDTVKPLMRNLAALESAAG